MRPVTGTSRCGPSRDRGRSESPAQQAVVRVLGQSLKPAATRKVGHRPASHADGIRPRARVLGRRPGEWPWKVGPRWPGPSRQRERPSQARDRARKARQLEGVPPTARNKDRAGTKQDLIKSGRSRSKGRPCKGGREIPVTCNNEESPEEPKGRSGPRRPWPDHCYKVNPSREDRTSVCMTAPRTSFLPFLCVRRMLMPHSKRP